MKKPDDVRIQIDVDSEAAKALDTLTKKLGYKRRRETVSTALDLLEWVVQQVSEGKKICSLENDQRMVEIVIPVFRRLKNTETVKMKQS